MKKASSDLLLLDVNVLLAIAWPNHQFHGTATRFLSTKSEWATCAFTQLGFIRLSSNPSLIANAKSPAEATLVLAEMTADSMHVYLDSLPAPTSEEWIGVFAKPLGHKQVTDLYLLQLAAANNAVLVTFDRKLQSLAAGPQCVRVLG